MTIAASAQDGRLVLRAGSVVISSVVASGSCNYLNFTEMPTAPSRFYPPTSTCGCAP